MSGTERVLLVDDEPAIAKAGRIALTRLGYRVTACTSPTEAVEVFDRDPEAFDVAITDLTMPHMTGIELAQQMRARRPDLPILLCTGYSDRMEKDGTPDKIFADFVQKPVIARELAMRVREVLAKNARP